jgi:hypothetical protein
VSDPTPPKDRPTHLSLPSKTPEELALENASLRASLDALAVHSHELELANRQMKASGEERERTMRHVALGVRREVRSV